MWLGEFSQGCACNFAAHLHYTLESVFVLLVEQTVLAGKSLDRLDKITKHLHKSLVNVKTTRLTNASADVLSYMQLRHDAQRSASRQ